MYFKKFRIRNRSSCSPATWENVTFLRQKFFFEDFHSISLVRFYENHSISTLSGRWQNFILRCRQDCRKEVETIPIESDHLLVGNAFFASKKFRYSLSKLILFLQKSFLPYDPTYMSFFLLRTNLIQALQTMGKGFWMLQADTLWRLGCFRKKI